MAKALRWSDFWTGLAVVERRNVRSIRLSGSPSNNVSTSIIGLFLSAIPVI